MSLFDATLTEASFSSREEEIQRTQRQDANKRHKTSKRRKYINIFKCKMCKEVKQMEL